MKNTPCPPEPQRAVVDAAAAAVRLSGGEPCAEVIKLARRVAVGELAGDDKAIALQSLAVLGK